MIKRRDAIRSLSLAPLLAVAPSGLFAGAATTTQNVQLLTTPTFFVYDAHLPTARAVAREAFKLGHTPHAIESDENGFWHSNAELDLGASSTIFGATTRRAYFVFEQLSRLHWSHRLNVARIIHEDDSFSFWTLRFQPQN